MKKFKFLSLALAIAISAAGVFAFTQPGKATKTGKTFSTYHYTSNSTVLEDMQDPANWQGVAPAQGCDEDGSIPCTVSTDKDLQEYLDEFTSASALINAAATRRN